MEVSESRVLAQPLSPKVGLSRSARYRRAMEALRIRDKHSQIVPLRFRPSQERMWEKVAPRLDAREKMWFICLKARQTYASTFFQALSFIRTLEQPNTHSLVIAQDLHTSHYLLDMAKRFYAHLPLPKLQAPRLNEIDFPFPGGTSKFRVISAGVAAKGRGTTQTCMHCSECAFWPHPEILEGIAQSMPDLPDTLWVLESTANGLGGQGRMFYEEWNRAVRGESDLTPIFIPWYDIPEYRRTPPVVPDDWDEEEKLLVELYHLDGEQLAWRRRTIATRTRGSVEIFHQEYPNSADEAFISSGQPAFDPFRLREQRATLTGPTVRRTLQGDALVDAPKGEVRVWREPEAGHQYVIGADTAEGFKGGDYAAAEVFDMASLEQVASVHGTIQPYDFACTLNAVGRYYGKALLCIEVYPQGHAVQDVLIRKFFYPNLHRWRGKPDRVRLTPARLYGWEQNVWSRPLLIEAGQRAVNRGLVTLHEEGLLDELLLFTKSDTGKYEAEVGHDDRVLAFLLALRSREENYVARTLPPFVSDEPDLRGVRVVEAREPEADARRKVHKVLAARAKEAVRSWMTR